MTQLRHDIADAMMDSPHPADHSDSGKYYFFYGLIGDVLLII